MMKIILSILLFLSILSGDIVMHIIQYEDMDISLIESPMEGESEKEVEESSKEESKIKVVFLHGAFNGKEIVSLAESPYHFPLSNSFLEYFSPPPDLS